MTAAPSQPAAPGASAVTPARAGVPADASLDQRADWIYQGHLDRSRRAGDRRCAWVLGAQWVAAVVLAVTVAPHVWALRGVDDRNHLWIALGLGGLFTTPALALTLLRPGWRWTRIAVGVAQALWSSVFIYLSGGRIQTHHHIFASLALLALYRDVRVIAAASLVAAGDQFLRGVILGQPFGSAGRGLFPFFELGGWVLLTDAVIFLGIYVSLLEVRAIARRQAKLERLNAGIDQRVQERTRELEQSRELFRVLVETTKTVPWQMEVSSLRFVYVGPQGPAMLGCALDEWLRPDFWRERLHPDDRAAATAAFTRSLRDRTHEEVEFRLRHDDGRWIWVRDIVSAGATGQAQLRGVLLDITERRRLELDLQQSQKLEAVGRLAAGIAHEINTPTQFVSDSIHFVKEAVNDLLGLVARYGAFRETVAAAAPVEAEALRQAEEEADLDYLREHCPKALARSADGLGRVATIVRSMKEFAHPDTREMEPVDLNQAISTTLVIARNEYKYVAEVDTDFGDLPQVTGHVGELNQVFLNIIVNAAHAISELVQGSELRGRITITTRPEGERVRISISDTGGGIPEPIRHRVFEPFFTTKEVGRGTGQGLALARSVVDRHGGTIGFDTEAGRGTTFHIVLPARQAPRHREAA